MKRPYMVWLAVIALIATGVAWRWTNWNYSIAPNLEIVTASALVAAVFLSRRMALIVPLGIMAISDVLIGNSNILLFTWSAFALIGLGGLAMRRWRGSAPKLMLASVGAAIGGSTFFFVFTNFGVWLLGDGTMYAKTWDGLMACYAMGIPFYRTMLLGNLVLVPAFMGGALLIQAMLAHRVERKTLGMKLGSR